MSAIPGKEFSKNFPTADYYEIGSYDVYSWCPAPSGSVTPATQVHVHVHVGDLMRLVLRLKSARACDEMIAALEKHREDVWGKRT